MSATDPKITRRVAIAGTAAMGAMLTAPVQAAAPLLGAHSAIFNRFTLGDFEITTIADGFVSVPTVHPFFGSNVAKEEVDALAGENLLPSDGIKLGFTPTLVNTGKELVLFDAGNGDVRRPNAGLLRDRLAVAGYTPEQVDVIAITHMHPDHIGGLMEDGEPAFPNARYVASTTEYNFWTNTDLASNEQVSGIHALVMERVAPLAEKMTFIDDEQDVVSGITAVAANGHTPGHTLFRIDNGGKSVLLTADTANHFVFSLQRPDWHFQFDFDPGKAAATRRRVFDMLATDEMAFIGYHMPFPSLGYVQASGNGFRYTPHSYQLEL
ncbi:MAG: MBL fold metallo-hydrolase [Alphaproteobacteria bacterium]|nr:MBL fold metallo-hydrolase [Alphaproteobacteria bacterium SS10]